MRATGLGCCASWATIVQGRATSQLAVRPIRADIGWRSFGLIDFNRWPGTWSVRRTTENLRLETSSPTQTDLEQRQRFSLRVVSATGEP